MRAVSTPPIWRCRQRRAGADAARIRPQGLGDGQLAAQHRAAVPEVPRARPGHRRVRRHRARPEDVVYSLRTWTDHVWAFLDAKGINRTAIVGEFARRAHRAADGDGPSRPDQPDGAHGLPGVGMTPTQGLAALQAYEPSHEAMRQLLKNFFAVNPELITEELVKIRYEASVADGAYEAYRAMFFDPKHKGSEAGHHRRGGTHHRHTDPAHPRAGGTRSCPWRSRSPCWTSCPTQTCTSSADADTGPRSSAPTSSPRWSQPTWSAHEHRRRLDHPR